MENNKTNCPKSSKESYADHSLITLAPKPFFGCNLISLLPHFGFPFASLGLLLTPLWRFLLSFLLPLAPFWRPFPRFCPPLTLLCLTFGSLWLPFGSLLVSLGSLLVPFPSLLLTQGSIFSLLLYPVLIFRIFLNFP